MLAFLAGARAYGDGPVLQEQTGDLEEGLVGLRSLEPGVRCALQPVPPPADRAFRDALQEASEVVRGERPAADDHARTQIHDCLAPGREADAERTPLGRLDCHPPSKRREYSAHSPGVALPRPDCGVAYPCDARVDSPSVAEAANDPRSRNRARRDPEKPYRRVCLIRLYVARVQPSRPAGVVERASPPIMSSCLRHSSATDLASLCVVQEHCGRLRDQDRSLCAREQEPAPPCRRLPWGHWRASAQRRKRQSRSVG